MLGLEDLIDEGHIALGEVTLGLAAELILRQLGPRRPQTLADAGSDAGSFPLAGQLGGLLVGDPSLGQCIECNQERQSSSRACRDKGPKSSSGTVNLRCGRINGVRVVAPLLNSEGPANRPDKVEAGKFPLRQLFKRNTITIQFSNPALSTIAQSMIPHKPPDTQCVVHAESISIHLI